MHRDPCLYLDDILQSIERIREYVHGMAFDAFQSDRKTIDAVVRNLEIIGEAVKALPDDIKEREPDIEWRKISALRNILAHQYFGVNAQIIWDIVER